MNAYHITLTTGANIIVNALYYMYDPAFDGHVFRNEQTSLVAFVNKDYLLSVIVMERM